MLGVWSMRLDTHCHLDAAAFDVDRDAVIARAQQENIQALVIPAVDAGNF
jgi:TatD DNase family protein